MLRTVAAPWMVMLAMTLSAAMAAEGQTHAPAHAEADGAHAAVPVHSQPILPVHDAIWAGVAVIAIAALFVAAASVGTIARPATGDEPPQPLPADDHSAEHHH